MPWFISASCVRHSTAFCTKWVYHTAALGATCYHCFGSTLMRNDNPAVDCEDNVFKRSNSAEWLLSAGGDRLLWLPVSQLWMWFHLYRHIFPCDATKQLIPLRVKSIFQHVLQCSFSFQPYLLLQCVTLHFIWFEWIYLRLCKFLLFVLSGLLCLSQSCFLNPAHLYSPPESLL